MVPLALAFVVVTVAASLQVRPHFLVTLGFGLGTLWGGNVLCARMRRRWLCRWFRHDVARCSRGIASLFSSVEQYAVAQDALEALGTTDDDPAPRIPTSVQTLVLKHSSWYGSPH